ncbi:Uncharacterized protein HZ326_22395 [Fusarium oxysporum f. sp. albedinis]|nr:Uncharacterized protein HZ326_22395 [Fusarium oxysporum f. sp. albedinis]
MVKLQRAGRLWKGVGPTMNRVVYANLANFSSGGSTIVLGLGFDKLVSAEIFSLSKQSRLPSFVPVKLPL